jgi:hypothetical protein
MDEEIKGFVSDKYGMYDINPGLSFMCRPKINIMH